MTTTIRTLPNRNLRLKKPLQVSIFRRGRHLLGQVTNAELFFIDRKRSLSVRAVRDRLRREIVSGYLRSRKPVRGSSIFYKIERAIIQVHKKGYRKYIEEVP